jgi:hypothetical protein
LSSAILRLAWACATAARAESRVDAPCHSQPGSRPAAFAASTCDRNRVRRFQRRLLLVEGRAGQRDLCLVPIRLDLEQQLSLLDIGAVGKPHLL